MRRSILASVPHRLGLVAVAAVSTFALTACEDGPTQTFNPAPPNAGDYLNGVNGAPVVDPTVKGFNTQTQGTGTNRQELCDAATKQKVWSKMVQQPIKPPSIAAGLDLSGGPTWNGITVEEAETPVWDQGHSNVISGLCQGDAQGDLFGDGTQTISWGDGQQVLMDYRVSNRKAIFLVMLPGYVGGITAKSRDGQHTYFIPIQSQVQKDNQPWSIDWKSTRGPGDWRNELHDALLATFAPGLPPSAECNSEGRCIQGNFGDVAYFYVPALGTGIWVPNQNAPAPQPSIMNRIDQYLSKIMPFAFAPPLLKLDAEGPTANAGKLGSAANPCVLKIGLKYSDFLSTCVAVTGDQTKDSVELNKLMGGLTHNTERFHFDITGIDVNFSNNHLAADQITTDSDKPAASDTSTRFTVDQAALGKFANEYTNNDPTQPPDRHGSGWVYFEYARLVQEQLNALTGGKHTLGDPACTGGQTDAQLRAAGCTGFEGFVTSAPTAGVKDPTMARGAMGINAARPYGLTSLKPGHHTISICNDLSTGKYTNCGESSQPGAHGDTFQTSHRRVLSILGNGQVSNLPTEAQDVRFYFKAWFTALVKYLKNAGNTALDSETLHNQKVDHLNLYFDSIGAGQFEIAEYVDRDFVDATHPPTDIVFTADVRNGIMNDYDFSRELYRGELALYTSMVDHRGGKNDPPGKQNTALLTNMFGSPVLATGWTDHTADGGPQYTASYCATHASAADFNKCKGQIAPTDANGNIILNENGDPLLAPYEGALGANKTVWALGANPATPVKLVSTDEKILSATIQIPLFTNPYDTSSAPPSTGASLKVLVPWAPKGPTVGFPVALDGTRDKFVESYQLDLGGSQVTANIDYDLQYDTQTHKYLDTIQFNAVETTDFLGDLFICQDSNTGDLLTARMYSSVATILDWFATHPGAYAACGMIIRYSPYGNYADYITSLQNGVRLGITQGGGFGRVVDATLFTPGQ